jgi:hypothetical protein
MKTTIDLPDALAKEARDLAREQGVSLRELVVDGLRRELTRRTTTRPEEVEFHFPTFRGDGLQPGVEWADLVEMSYEDGSA